MKKSLEKLIDTSLAIENNPLTGDDLGYMARALILATLPHSKPNSNEFVRVNGDYSLSMLAPSKIGLPYGSMPRLILAWLTREAVRTKERELELGDSLSEFMRELGLNPTGGRWGTITTLKTQLRKLIACSIQFSYSTSQTDQYQNIQPIRKAVLWWDEAKQPDQKTLWKSTITLSEEFFKEVTDRPIPIDLRALKALKRSPLALDLYIWLTYRVSYLKKPVDIPWDSLRLQLGAEYKQDKYGRENFKKAILNTLKKIELVYPEVKVQQSEIGLLVKPSKTSIPKKAVEN